MGYVVFVTGIPSSGKSTVTNELLVLEPSLQVIETDAEIRKAGSGLNTLLNARTIFRHVLDKIEELSGKVNVVVDGALPASYLAEAHDRFGDQALLVSLQITEHERRSRERKRRDRSPIRWDERMTALGGGPELYDLVIDATATSAAEAAREILEATNDLDDG